MRDISPFLEQFTRWASGEAAITAALLLGSFARGTAHDDSDIDVVIVTTTPERYLQHQQWLRIFGQVHEASREDWGVVQSLRVYYANGDEVEFGLTTPQWAHTDPIDEGTRRVVRDGARILVDKTGLLAALLAAVGGDEAHS